MYLIIDGVKYAVSRRLRTSDTVKFLSVSPKVEDISGTIQMFRDDGFLMSEDNVADYQRISMVGSLLTLTNAPVPVPAPAVEEDTTILELAADHEYRLSLIELGLTEEDLNDESGV